MAISATPACGYLVAARLTFDFGRCQREAHLLLDRPGQKAAHAVLLPIRRAHQFLDDGAFRTAQEYDELRLFGRWRLAGLLLGRLLAS